MDTDEKIALIVEDSIANYRRVFGMAMSSAVDLTPIERLMCAGFLVHSLQCSFPPVTIDFCLGRSLDDCINEARKLACRVVITPQVEVGPYRADFVVVGCNAAGNYCAVVVECDGHDYHEKTKKQAANDKKRDRFMVQNDLHLLRYTGSEIWRDPTKCAYEVIGFVGAKVREWEFMRAAREEEKRDRARNAANAGKPWRKEYE
ncbi:endonuclease domain-containing protein [Methyloceanibacter caenitepidi]|uniref:Restriction endonuclease type II-like domain-containing protein n=1 Tax=Methyloceanibacter caenitepidi TaxID=1384459 RepID=A0A0A8K5W2_9HYPH|nr:hypothetical protein [Methyloceanibacter caenitepidi]BAQ18333.1 hypothetical protein GL4_2900 [Methyloceanibacter caenitepidi]